MIFRVTAVPLSPLSLRERVGVRGFEKLNHNEPTVPLTRHSRGSALLSGIKFSQVNKCVVEVGQHKALPLLASAVRPPATL